MAVSVNWLTKTFSVPQADLTFVSGTLYEMDTETYFRSEINGIMASEDGIVFADAIDHNTEYTVVGTTYARKIEMINGYSLEFTPDSQWSVRLTGSNNNLFDIENGILGQNQVQVIPQNSAGLIKGSITDQTVEGSTTVQGALRLILSVLSGKVSGVGSGTEVFRDIADTKDRVTVTIDGDGNRTAVTRDDT